jgi:hypothetical protein
MVSRARRLLVVLVATLAFALVLSAGGGTTGAAALAGAPAERAAARLPVAADTAEPTCPPNDNIPALGSGPRCIAEQMLSTRNYLLPDCFDARALQPDVLYGPWECKNGSGEQIEAIAQTRAIVQLNAQGVYGDSAPLPGITPNVQWEVNYGPRPDIVVYDRDYFEERDQPGAPAQAGVGSEIQIIEVKTEKNGGDAGARKSLDKYVRGLGGTPFPRGARNRPLVPYDLSGYADHFRVLKRACGPGVMERREDHYTVYPGATAGALLVSHPQPVETPCGSPQPPPNEEEEEEEDHNCKICNIPIPGPGQNQDPETEIDWDAALQQLVEAYEERLSRSSWKLRWRSPA